MNESDTIGEMEVGLFDIVPWTHGYAHSWALRWMLGEGNAPAAQEALLGLFLPDQKGPWRVENVVREFRVGRSRADLRFEPRNSDGESTVVLVETKVNDAFRESQVQAYLEVAGEVIVYAPGLTGLLHEGREPLDGERWITGRQVVDALADVELPPLLSSYREEVAAQADRMDAARQAVLAGDEFSSPDDISEVSAGDIEAVAWIVEVAKALRARATDVRLDDSAHNYYGYWGDSWRQITDGAAAYVEVDAKHGGWEYVITIKIAGWDADVPERLAAFDAVSQAGQPWDGWRRARRLGTESCRVWSLEAGEMTPSEVADAMVRASEYLDRFAPAPS